MRKRTTKTRIGDLMITPSPGNHAGFTSNARRAMEDNPDYFVWWYTAKSLGLAVVAAYAAYLLGKEHGRAR